MDPLDLKEKGSLPGSYRRPLVVVVILIVLLGFIAFWGVSREGGSKVPQAVIDALTRGDRTPREVPKEVIKALTHGDTAPKEVPAGVLNALKKR